MELLAQLSFLGLVRRAGVARVPGVAARAVLRDVARLAVASDSPARLRPRGRAGSAVAAALRLPAALRACARDISRDFRRAAAFGWMMPRLAALSSALTA